MSLSNRAKQTKKLLLHLGDMFQKPLGVGFPPSLPFQSLHRKVCHHGHGPIGEG